MHRTRPLSLWLAAALAALVALAPTVARAQSVNKAIEKDSTGNLTASFATGNKTITVASGGTLNAVSGSTVTLAGTTTLSGNITSNATLTGGTLANVTATGTTTLNGAISGNAVVPAAQGGAGSVNGLLRAAGTGAVSAATVTRGLQYSAGTLEPVFASSAVLEASRTIAGWGDSLTAGAGGSGTTYLTRLAALTGFATYNGGVGGESGPQIATRMLAASSRYGQLVVIWAGRNGVLTDSAAQLSAIASMVAALTTDHYVVLSVINATTETSGTPEHAAIVAFNAQLASAYGSHYLDVRSYLVSLVPNANDIINGAYLSDTLHLNAAGYSAVGDYIFANWSALTATQTVVIGPAQLYNTLNAPPGIGTSVPNAGSFTTLVANSTIATTGVTITPAISTNSPIIALNKNSGSGRAISLTSDGSSFQFDTKLVPASDNAIDLGFSSSILRWRNIYLSGIAYALGGVALTNNTGIGENSLTLYKSGTNRTLAISNDGSSWQFDTKIIPGTDNAHDLGFSTSILRWRNLYLSGTANAAALLIGGTGGTSIAKIRHGTATLVGGAATVSDTSTASTTRIFLTSQSDGGTPGWLRVSARSAGASFTITSSSGTDTSTVGWVAIDP